MKKLFSFKNQRFQFEKLIKCKQQKAQEEKPELDYYVIWVKLLENKSHILDENVIIWIFCSWTMLVLHYELLI